MKTKVTPILVLFLAIVGIYYIDIYVSNLTSVQVKKSDVLGVTSNTILVDKEKAVNDVPPAVNTTGVPPSPEAEKNSDTSVGNSQNQNSEESNSSNQNNTNSGNSETNSPANISNEVSPNTNDEEINTGDAATPPTPTGSNIISDVPTNTNQINTGNTNNPPPPTANQTTTTPQNWQYVPVENNTNSTTVTAPNNSTQSNSVGAVSTNSSTIISTGTLQ